MSRWPKTLQITASSGPPRRAVILRSGAGDQPDQLGIAVRPLDLCTDEAPVDQAVAGAHVKPSFA